MEFGFEHVFHVLRVGGYYVVEDVDVDGPGGGVGEEVGVPVAEIVVL